MHLSPVRDHNELMFQVLPPFLEVNCGHICRRTGRSVGWTCTQGPLVQMVLIIRSPY